MEAALVRLVWHRAESRCEYCQIHQEFVKEPLEIDHIISKKHKGATDPVDRALSCFQ